jgi:hypothetical protein
MMRFPRFETLLDFLFEIVGRNIGGSRIGGWKGGEVVKFLKDWL